MARARLLLGTALSALLIAACSTAPTNSADGGAQRPERQTVVYSATGAGLPNPTAPNITYATLEAGGAPHGETGVLTNVPLPWSKTVIESVRPNPRTGLWPYYYLDVHNGSNASSYVTCSISIDGTTVSSGKQSGANATASCGAPSHTTAPIFPSRPPVPTS